MFYTYIWRDAVGTPFYVGKGGNDGHKRARNTAKRSSTFRAEYAKGGCYVEIADEFVLESEAFAHECLLIDRYGRREFGGLLVNRTDGGEGAVGRVLTDLHKARIGAAHRGKTISPEHIERVAALKRGVPLTPQHRAKIAKAGIGRRHTDQSKAKLRAAHLGKTNSPESRNKMSRSHRGVVLGDAHRESISASRRLAGPSSRNSTGFKGVRLDPRRGRYEVKVHSAGQTRFIGTFSTAEDAARAYDEAAIKIWGLGNCYLNIIKAGASVDSIVKK